MGKQFTGKLEKIDDQRWMIPETYMKGMRVPGIIFSDERMINDILDDNAPLQVANAAHLPGIVKASIAMPDIHWGYGLPIGGVIATDVEGDGVITPGGVGYDINCGVRLMRSNISFADIALHLKSLVEELYRQVPAGVGSEGDITLTGAKGKNILTKGAQWAVDEGYGWSSDIENSEENGAISGADPGVVPGKAVERGRKQAGTLGSGNHFLEIQEVTDIFDDAAAEGMRIEKGQVVVMIHTGSRGLGHQVCSEYASRMIGLMKKHRIDMPDKQLACVPVDSFEGKEYLGAMRAAANYAWANRQVITHLVRMSFAKVLGERPERLGMHLVYDVAHNIAKIEEHETGGRLRRLCVHRKGATRALPPGHKNLPGLYKKTGQPVIIPGDMGRCSYLLAGAEGSKETFHSACHGAGRLMSRNLARQTTRGRSIQRELEEKGIILRYTGRNTAHEEVSEAYKDVNNVVDVVARSGIAKKVARMRPLGVVKG